VPVGNLERGDPRKIGDKYTLLGRLGLGTGGKIFLGRSADNHLAAIMVVREELAGHPRFRADFTRWVAGGRYPDGPVIDADPQAAQPWLAVRYDDGVTLAAAVDEHGPLSLPAVVVLAARMARELAAVHETGKPRGLKPSDILLTRDGPQLLGPSAAPADGSAETVDFTSPELAFRATPGPASDIFSLGAILAFAASGEKPYGTGSLEEIRARILNDAPELGHVPAELRPLIERCMAREPTARPTAAQFLADLTAEIPETAGWLSELPQGWLPGILSRVRRNGDLPDWSWEDHLGISRTWQQGGRARWLGRQEPPWWNWEGKYPPPPEEKPKKKWGRIAVTIGATASVSVAAAITWTVAFSNHGSSAAAKPPDSPTAASSVTATPVRVQAPSSTAPALPLSASRLDWKGLVTYTITAGSPGSNWRGTSKPWQDDWVISADCSSGPCGATLKGYITADPFTMKLSRAGATYSGSVAINHLWYCQVGSQYLYNDTKLSITITAIKAEKDSGGSEITAFRGTASWKISPVDQGDCGATYTMQLQSAKQY